LSADGLEIDNRETRSKLKEAVDEVMTALDIVCRSLECFNDGIFDVERLCRIRTECNLMERKAAPRGKLRELKPAEDGKGIVNEELRERLQQWRSDRFKKDNVPAYTIMHQETLLLIASVIPVTKEELLSIKGFGETRYKKYGPEIIAICREYKEAPEGLM
jgi:superfamily II DNA helicase RecQ